MALRDVTAEGVERSIAEFDRLKRDAFLDKYGFGRARGYFLVRGERRYDSKAIIGVAHGYDRPDLGPLGPQDFSGGESTVARHLESLGFGVEKRERNPPWVDKELILALDLYLREGPLSATDQAVVALSNDLKALSVHSERPDELRFRNPNSVKLKLANFAALDSNLAWRGMTRGSKRDAEIWERYASEEDALAELAMAIRQGRELPTGHSTEAGAPRVITTDVEAQHVEQFQVSVTGQVISAERHEQRLVLAYRDYLERKSHRVTRHLYPQHEFGSPLACDLVDETARVIYEAKGNVRRASVRMAIGQLLDYRRFERATMTLAVLLPRRPPSDLIELVRSVPASAVWRTKDGFANAEP
ncbi:MAG: hypothetical protein F4Y68_05380 [Boseongicola sp. SB0665_bin_10]|nr:hypothetical protein [Boseongicola sp. SB0665_bin_10]